MYISTTHQGNLHLCTLLPRMGRTSRGTNYRPPRSRTHGGSQGGQAEAGGVLHFQTAVLHHIDTRRHQTGGGGVVADAALQPHRLGRGGDQVVDVPIYVRAPASAAPLFRNNEQSCNRNHVRGLAKQGSCLPRLPCALPSARTTVMRQLPLPTWTWWMQNLWRTFQWVHLRKTVTTSSVFESGTSATVRYTGWFRM